MTHLTHEEILSYVDGDKEAVNMVKASKHLDKCLECIHQLQNLASISLFFEDIATQAKLQRHKALLRNCFDAEMMLDFIENKVQWKEKQQIEEHLAKCKYCQDELKFIRSISEKSDVEVTEKIEPEKYLPKSLRYSELLLTAYEREAVLEKEPVKIPLFEKIRVLLFPRQPALVPLGFAERIERDREFYKELTDEEIASFCAQIDKTAWEELLIRFTPYAFGIIKNFGLYKYREDIWQDTLAVLVAGKIKDYKEEKGTLKDFIRGIVVNQCRVKWREIKRQPISIEEITLKYIKKIISSVDQLARLIEEEEITQITEVLNSLPNEFLNVVQAMLNGLKDEEIADLLDIPVNTVRSRKRRIRMKVVEIIGKKHPEILEKIKMYKWGIRNL